MRSNHDAKVTYEGDNNVLLQTTSQWLLRQMTSASTAQQIADDSTAHAHSDEFPASTIRFMAQIDAKLKTRFSGAALVDVCNPGFVLECYEWLLCWLLRETRAKRDEYERLLDDSVAARSLTQVFAAHTLAIVFAEYNVVTCFWARCQQCSDSTQRTLSRISFTCSVCGVYTNTSPSSTKVDTVVAARWRA
ncbi:peroxisomal acyl-coenzyme A oxidase 3-like [Nilaparvata lugens]|uniref:peroxisomal acyl-coenzyme A oxidase 3-like n=1 Tax=Nilaparvata lugens TaxID=108931 RepID=UPI00193D735B|nr:peroxisomal acyl-coenzyme A oxidase 3-like [Nilaparvata lugens]